MTNCKARLEKVREYIELNLDEQINLDTLSKVAHLSKHHFHRLFSAEYGITVATYVRLLRLKKAAYQIAYRDDLSITTIALDCNYESSEAFSRAFRKVFEQSPSAFRTEPNWAAWQSHFDGIFKLRNEAFLKYSDFSVEYAELPTLDVAVFEHRDSPVNLQYSVGKFIEWRKANKIPPNRFRTFNLIYDDPEEVLDTSFRFDLCCQIDKSTDISDPNISLKTLQGGRCAKIRFVGSDDVIGWAVRYLYTKWLPQSGEKLRDVPVLFERVTLFPDVTEHEMVTDVYLPIV
ncbi:AraC family transcriptional regulator [Enterovibrio makurazakiensis]|uniref:AraC family transcriptional regulator n=1 Tax=Enterovibrio makurazakiensis TaxID=2910232 RepID=UPI003D24CA22